MAWCAYFAQINDQSMNRLGNDQNIQSREYRKSRNTWIKEFFFLAQPSSFSSSSYLFRIFFSSVKSASVVMIIPDYYCYYESPICDTYAYYIWLWPNSSWEVKPVWRRTNDDDPANECFVYAFSVWACVCLWMQIFKQKPRKKLTEEKR